MTKLEKINKIVFYLGKGLWKGVPVIGPIIEEVFYKANKELLLSSLEKGISKIPQDELDKLFVAIESNEFKLQELFENFQLDLKNSLISFKDEIAIKPILIQNRLGEFKEKIISYAFEWENKMEDARILGEKGKIKKSQEAFIDSAKALNKIVDAYRTNKFLFNEEAREKIDTLLLVAEKHDDDSSLSSLIKAVQLINFEVEVAINNSI